MRAVLLLAAVLLFAGCAPGHVSVGASVGYYDDVYWHHPHHGVYVSQGYVWRHGYWVHPWTHHRIWVHRHHRPVLRRHVTVHRHHPGVHRHYRGHYRRRRRAVRYSAACSLKARR